MHDLRKNFTGPRTPEGKAVSSQNPIKHGCRSEKTVLRDEDPAEFEALVAGWFQRYDPQDPVAVVLVEQTARAHWFLKRNAKRLEEVEWELPGNAWNWTDEHQKLYNNFSRYKTTAERSFLRFYKELQSFYKHPERHRSDLREAALAEASQIASTLAPAPTSHASPTPVSRPLDSAPVFLNPILISHPEPDVAIPLPKPDDRSGG